jgi:hypothetical protein
MSEIESMYGECYVHNLRWYGGGEECPLCVASAALDAAREALQKISALTKGGTPGSLWFELEKISTAALKQIGE